MVVMKIIRRILLLTATYASISGCVHFYSHKPIEMRVVDSNTSQPIKGVIVVAHWSLSRGSIGGNVETGTLEVLETVSDNDGRLYFPEWGPLISTTGYLDYRGAQLIFFKRGYYFLATQNTDTTWRAKHPDQSQWNGKTIQLTKFDKSFPEYAEHVAKYARELDDFRYGDNCEWKKIPLLLVEIHKLSEELENKGIKLQGWRLGSRLKKVTDVHNIVECGSPQNFFRKYIRMEKTKNKPAQKIETRTLRPSISVEEVTPTI
jgi:hypothetical protein